MHPVEIKRQLENIILIADTREQGTEAFKRRIDVIGWQCEREKLNAGDYSAKCEVLDLSELVTIERKMNIDELANCFCNGRKRFEREFERAKESGIKLYLLVEECNWEKIYGHRYRSKMTPQALIASCLAFSVRYGCQFVFCRSETSPLLIKEILYRELKERLENQEFVFQSK